mmetsp:Transcript_10077/g.1573  ORF Transcript_10077/g.1573 Transcript_10077/m.1573 type:complete len:162 (+) Transcript_10077:111-596(+)
MIIISRKMNKNKKKKLNNNNKKRMEKKNRIIMDKTKMNNLLHLMPINLLKIHIKIAIIKAVILNPLNLGMEMNLNIILQNFILNNNLNKKNIQMNLMKLILMKIKLKNKAIICMTTLMLMMKIWMIWTMITILKKNKNQIILIWIIWMKKTGICEAVKLIN